MPEHLQELKKIISDNIATLQEKVRPRFSTFGPDEDEVRENTCARGELWAYKQILSEIDKRLARIQHESNVDEVATEISYEMEHNDDPISVKVREGVYIHVQKELLYWHNRNLDWLYDKGRKIAAKYMYDKTGGGE
jgi:hypothetical protein